MSWIFSASESTLAAITPPAGPDSNAFTGRLAMRTAGQVPPFDAITRTGVVKPESES